MNLREKRAYMLESARKRKLDILRKIVNNLDKRALLEEYLVHNGLVLIPLGNLAHHEMSLLDGMIKKSRILSNWDSSIVYSLRENGLLLATSETEILYMGKDTTVERVI